MSETSIVTAEDVSKLLDLIAELRDQQKDLLAALERAMDLLWATERFVAANPLVEEFTVDYDEATCDGACLAEDCRVAAIVAGEAIERAEGQS